MAVGTQTIGCKREYGQNKYIIIFYLDFLSDDWMYNKERAQCDK